MKTVLKLLVVLIALRLAYLYVLPVLIPSFGKPVVNLPKSDDYEAITNRHSYDSLADEAAKKIYREIEKNVYSAPSKEKNLLCEFKDLDETAFHLACEAFYNDNPNVFWATEGISLNGKRFVIYSAYPEDELAEMKTDFYAAADKFFNSVPGGLSEEELAKYTHDYLLEHCEYDYDAANADGSRSDSDYEKRIKASTAYGTLVNGKAICAGYARAYQFLLNRLGVDSVYITGQGEDVSSDITLRYSKVNHAWNSVKIDGKWYMTDVTWDDADPANSYQYYKLSNAEMFKTHFAEEIDQSEYKYYRSINLNLYGDCIFLPE